MKFNCYDLYAWPSGIASLSDRVSAISITEPVFDQIWLWYGMGPKMVRHPIVRQIGGANVMVPVAGPTRLTLTIELPVPAGYHYPPTVTFEHYTWPTNEILLADVYRCIESGEATVRDQADLKAVREEYLALVSKQQKYIQLGVAATKKPKMEIREQGYSLQESKLVPCTARMYEVNKEQISPGYIRLRVCKPLAGRKVTDPGVCGLSNIGNTCFMNSALQCLSNSAPLRDMLLQLRKHPQPTLALLPPPVAPANGTDGSSASPLGTSGALTTTTNSLLPAIPEDTASLSLEDARLRLSTLAPVTASFAELLEIMWSGQVRSTTPSDLKAVFAKRVKRFSGYEQQDSIEFLNAFLDVVHEELNPTKRKQYRERRDEEDAKYDDLALSKVYWENFRSNNQTPLLNMFYGQVRSVLQCLTCNKVSTSFDAFSCLPVPINVKNMYSHDVVVSWATGDPAADRYTIKVRVRVAAECSVLNLQQDVHQALESAKARNPKVPPCKSPYALLTTQLNRVQPMHTVVQTPKKHYSSDYYSYTMLVVPSLQAEIEDQLAAEEVTRKEDRAKTPPPPSSGAEPSGAPPAGGEATPLLASDPAVPPGEQPTVTPLAESSAVASSPAAGTADAPSGALIVIGPQPADGSPAAANTAVLVSKTAKYVRLDVYMMTYFEPRYAYRNGSLKVLSVSVRRTSTLAEVRRLINDLVAPQLRLVSQRSSPMPKRVVTAYRTWQAWQSRTCQAWPGRTYPASCPTES